MKKPVKVLGGILLLALAGYLFVYPNDYIVRFEARTFPGPINQTIKIWHEEVGVADSPVTQEDLYHLEQLVQAGDSVHRYRWEIEPLTDSTSRVTVKVRDMDHSLMNKLKVPFGGSAVEMASKRYVKEFAESLKTHIEQFRVRIVGEAETPSTFYAYVNLTTSQHKKAAGMMDNYMLLSNLLYQNQVTLNGPPMIVVNRWEQEKDSLNYNFCFPIIRSDHLPQHPEVSYKRIFPERALKAEYYGNYITSDRAWYALLDYAEQNGIPVDPTPVEVFYNNPNTGGDMLNWKAEIYLPILEENK
ncbi:GyrI-like domain-containing protein [Robiginitalea sediminis]|uniref:GyrI-like domain-containing protein n=1 Tax=Robiginitalea sediminis TaxID=1982593 RepID=UPI000B4B8A2E|nr:GyrI-like domain-containing protein [Robiginitalea sediminis]